MRGVRKFVVVGLALLALLSACKRKKPPVPPPQEQAPTISAPPATTLPQPQPEVPPPSATTPAPPAAATTTKPKHKPKKHVAVTSAPKPEKKAVVKDGGGAEVNPQLAADLPAGEALHQRQTTAQLQTLTENNLRGLTRTLSDDEQAMIRQIRAYLQQSHAAEADGDTERAYNLALKAHLLSDELVKR